VLHLKEEGESTWIDAKPSHTPNPVAYGSSVSLEDGIFCVGGETNQGLTNRAFMMQWNDSDQTIRTIEMPSLPIPIANASITAIQQKIYLAGGETNQKVSDAFYCLDLQSPHPEWQALPGLPLAMSHAGLVAQSNGKIHAFI